MDILTQAGTRLPPMHLANLPKSSVLLAYIHNQIACLSAILCIQEEKGYNTL